MFSHSNFCFSVYNEFFSFWLFLDVFPLVISNFTMVCLGVLFFIFLVPEFLRFLDLQIYNYNIWNNKMAAALLIFLFFSSLCSFLHHFLPLDHLNQFMSLFFAVSNLLLIPSSVIVVSEIL